MGKKERFILIKEVEGQPKISWVFRDPEEEMLEFFHREIECDTITMTGIAKGIDVVSDDIALLKSGEIILYTFAVEGRTYDIPGNCIIAGMNTDGETLPVTEELYNWFIENVTLTAKKGTVE